MVTVVLQSRKSLLSVARKDGSMKGLVLALISGLLALPFAVLRTSWWKQADTQSRGTSVGGRQVHQRLLVSSIPGAWKVISRQENLAA
jgi:hypothetical protein